jgi:thiamine-monophosphate kinase
MSRQLDPDAMPTWLASIWPRSVLDPTVIAGVDEDDCAVLRLNKELIVLTVDYLNARPIGLQLGIATLADLGRLVVAITISDLCGTGAQPHSLLMGITMERGSSEEDFKSLMLGVRGESAKWGVSVIGGDTKIGNSRALLSVGIGTADSESHLFLKNRAKAGDLLWCSGPLGSCNAAAFGLQREGMSSEWKDWAKSAILVPSIPLDKSRLLSQARLGKAGIDVSDGLGADLHRMCRASGVGVMLDSSAIPTDPRACELASKMGVEPWAFAFCGGGDFQFLVTTDQSAAGEVRQLGFHPIGEITATKDLMMRVGEGTIPLPNTGHRDARGLSFLDEIATLLESVAGRKE